MRIAFVLHVARRYLFAPGGGRHASTGLGILGVAAGVMTVVAVTGVMNGFQLGFIEDILAVSSYHLQVEGPPLSSDALASLGGVEGVRSVTRFADGQALVSTARADPRGAMIRGIDAADAGSDADFLRHLEILEGAFDVSGGAVVGAELAYALGVGAGDTVEVLTLAAGETSARRTSLPVMGIFRTGFFDFDASLLFVSLQMHHAIAGETPKALYGLKLRDPFSDQAALDRVKRALEGGGYAVLSWREFNRAFFGALRLEKVLMFVLPGLIFVVVAFSIYHSQKRSVLERREEIALLGALGARAPALRAVWGAVGALIGFAGALPGLAAGLAITANVDRIFGSIEGAVNTLLGLAELALGPLLGGGGFSIFSPTFFYLTEVPSRVLPVEALGITAAGVLCASLAALLAASRVAGQPPATVLRHE